MPTLEELEARIERLEYKFRIMRQLTDPKRYPFGQYILDADLTEGQVGAIMSIVEETDKHIISEQPMTFFEFADRLFTVVPERTGDHKFARNVLATLHEGGQFQEVYDHMMQEGMRVFS